ncbi:MAG: DUF2721 domain-containing protein [Paracoccaceae bacterium]|nr:DUF2721 domain-containing protein [Paracoccaceae bacterium]
MENLFLLPAILFPAIPLMMTNFANRYSSLASLIRKIHDELIDKDFSKNDPSIIRSLEQIEIFRKRLSLNRMMQTMAILSFIVNLLSIFFVFLYPPYFIPIFLLGVFLFSISISLYIFELRLAVQTLNKHLEDLQDLRVKL